MLLMILMHALFRSGSRYVLWFEIEYDRIHSNTKDHNKKDHARNE